MSVEGGVPYQTDFMDSGWTRWLPGLAWRLNALVSCLQIEAVSGSPWAQPLDSLASRVADGFGGPQASAWTSEIESLGLCESDEERAEERAAMARLEHLLRVAGLPDGADADDLLQFMLRLGLFDRSVDEVGREWWRVVEPLPLPAEKLELDPEEVGDEDRIRWAFLTLEAQGKLIDHLLADESSDQTLASLRRLSEDLILDPETVREALLVVCSGASFTPSHDLELLEVHQDFTITLDRDAFAREHVGVQAEEPDSEG